VPKKLAFTALALSLTYILNAAASETSDYEDTSFRFQSTYIWQRKTSFNADYNGPNSLSPNLARSYTATITGYWGFRPWTGGELYFNPEITQGVPFSGLAGLGAFTNGELTRTAGTEPHLYRQRLFLRQTWGLGGGEQQVQADLNQMAGSVDNNRVVLTLGNFSTLDVFDDNLYAKDPRVQFMNAGFMAPLAYDYAADARGFGYGFALEWYQQDWAYRIGRMTGPQTPNMLPTDYRIFKHYGDQVEIEHSHTLMGQPGKLRLLVWKDRAKMASFDDALAYYNANQNNTNFDPQTIVAVRGSDKNKYGIGINIEQALREDVGYFLRAMKADGKTETLAFTETDGSIGTGLSIKGNTWQRPKDTLGIGYIYNTLSKDRRRYLEAGGISFFLGDGSLNYRPEQVFETYYSTHVWQNVYLTLDYQHLMNPGYNADRGPVDFAAARLHAEF
jgi:high affinity Mn2+ porin